MERARAWFAVGAVAAAMTAAALGATAAPPRDITADQALVAARGVPPAPALTPPPADEEHVAPTVDPIVIGDPHDGMGGLPSEEPMDMGGMDMDGHGQGAGPSASPSTGPEATDDHQVDASPMQSMGGMDMDGSPMPVDDHGTTGDDDHGGAAAGGGDADGGHGDGEPTAERQRELVLGGFGLLNGLVFAAAALLRRRDRAAAARKAAATIERAFISPTDASR